MFALVEILKNSPKYCNNTTMFSDELSYAEKILKEEVKYSLEYHVNHKTTLSLVYLPVNSNPYMMDAEERIIGGILINKIEF